jgi:peptidoglycan/xylan/chitin deacetylase (PgdA/CDA1 family)
MTERDSTRRRFLSTIGAVGVAGVAGCAGDADSTTPSNATATGTPTAQSTATATSTADETATPSQSNDADFSRGELVEDFENYEEARWGTIRGDVTTDTNEAYAGSQSLRLSNKNGGAAGIFKAFPDGLDLSKHDLSLAVKLDKPVSGKISMEFIAPARSDMLVSKRFIPGELNSWVRIDLGYTGRKGDPDLSAVQELRLLVLSEDGTPINYWVDDLRKIPKPKKGKVMMVFDDAVTSQYEVAFKRMQEKGWGGGVAVIPDAINSEGNLTTGQMREMRDAGWDMMAHPQLPKPLPEYSEQRQREAIERTYNYLDLKGFPKGARHFVAPYHRVSQTTLDIVSEFHETGQMFGACPNNAQHPSNLLTMSRVMGRDPRGTRRVLNIAEEYNQMVSIGWHGIGDGPDYRVSTDDFENVINHIAKKDMDVVTPSQFLDGI